MGNYYYHTQICEHCQRSNVLHVGKISMGWTFGFRAHRGQPDGSPDIVSLADWERVFKTIPGVLVDEEEVVIENPLLFLSQLVRPSAGQQEVEDSPERLGGHRRDPAHEWRDAEGFRFCDQEFS